MTQISGNYTYKSTFGSFTAIKILFSIVILLPLVSYSQLTDSLKYFTESAPKILVKLDSRNAFVVNSAVRIKGIKVGLSHARRMQYGIGYNWMNSKYLVVNQEDSSHLKLRYLSAFTEYTFYQDQHWQLSIPVQLGLGFTGYSELGESNLKSRTPAFLYEPGLTVEYLFLKYFGVGLGFGYRLAVKKDVIPEPLTSPVYIFKFKIYFDKIYGDFIKKE